MKITMLAPAKLNLFLDITGRRSDGYHLVNMVMQSVSLYDEVTVTLCDSGIRITCSNDSVPCDESNTAYKAASGFFKAVGIEDRGAVIKLKKRIPSQAGMAGGSSDAAAVLAGLNELFDCPLEKDELCELAEEIGADVPFCLTGGTMTAGGIGTILSPLPDIPDCHFVIVKPEFSISTKDAYERSDTIGYDKNVSPEHIVSGICNGSPEEIGRWMYNKFEEVAGIDEIEQIKQRMTDSGALGACMTGSGSAVFGLFDDEDKAEDCKSALSKVYDEVFLVRPVPEGVKEK